MTTPTYALPSSTTITRRVLDNGVVVLVYENPAVGSVTIQGSLRAGSVYEALEDHGLASMTAAGLLRGTATRDFDALNGALEDIGAELDFSGGRHRVNFSGRALTEDLPLLLDVTADALRYPTFPAQEIEQERARRITELNFAQQDTRYMASREFCRALYPANHPFHYSTYGSLDSLPRLTADNVRAYHQHQYGPDKLIIVIVGAVKSEQAITLVEQAFGDWRNPQQAAVPTLPDVNAPENIIRVNTILAGKTQSDIVLGSVGPSRYADDYRAAALANSILGEFGMMGRIGHVIREELGLAYYAYSRLEAGQGRGSWQVIAGVAPDNVELAIEKARDEIHHLTSELVSEADLDDNQSYFTGRLPLRLESNGGLAATIHTLERYELGLDYLVNYRDAMYSITREDVLAAAQRYLHPDKLVISVAGPQI